MSEADVTGTDVTPEENTAQGAPVAEPVASAAGFSEADGGADTASHDASVTEGTGAEAAQVAADEHEDSDESGEASEAGREAAGPAKRRARSANADDLEREGEVAADFLERLLDIADLDGDIDVDVDGDRAAVAIVDSDEGRVPRRLVGQEGQVLEALQELTRMAVQAETGERSRLMLDVAGYRAGRRQAVVEEAREAIAAVRDSGEPQSLSPMTAFERKVAHDEALAAGFTSESEGAEPRRYVVISQK